MKPPIKYVGGKGKLLNEIENYVPKDTTIIVEPFCGSAALSFSKNRDFFLTDKSPELINFLKVLSDEKTLSKFMDLLGTFEQSHSKEFFMSARKADRLYEMDELPELYRAARYYYIIYAGYNGLYRVNKKNWCNTPWGKRGFKADTQHLINCHIHLRERCKGILYQEFDDMGVMESIIDEGSKPFVFIDPPYYGDKVFKQYTPEGDGGDFYWRLSNYLYKLEDADIPFLMTNTYCEYISEMFYEFGVDKVATKYTVAADGEKRGTKFEAFVHNANIDKLIEEGSWSQS